MTALQQSTAPFNLRARVITTVAVVVALSMAVVPRSQTGITPGAEGEGARPLCDDADGDWLCDRWEDGDTDGDADPATTPGPDTDGDGRADYLDDDDDGDGIPTIAESADPNRDGDPRDATDADRDGQPDHLDRPTTPGGLTVGAEHRIDGVDLGPGVAGGDDDRPLPSIASIGDVDGDGIVDLAVGSPGQGEGLDTGAVRLLFLDVDGNVTAARAISGLGDPDGFGTSVAAIGDLNGDGVPDMAVGAPGEGGDGVNRGAVHILFLNRDGTVEERQAISGTDGGLDAMLDDGDQFGRAVTGIGDLDGDGLPDIVVGASGDDGGGPDRGAIHVLFLDEDGRVQNEQKVSQVAGGLSATLGDGDRFGRSVTGIGDLDGDGTPDIVVGAPLDDDTGLDRGSAHVLFLEADGTVRAEQQISGTTGGLRSPPADHGQFASSLAGIGDIDGDGHGDLAVGEPFRGPGGRHQGSLHILALEADGTVKDQQTISGSGDGLTATLDDDQRIAVSVTGIGDLDGDGYPGLAVAALDGRAGSATPFGIHVLDLDASPSNVEPADAGSVLEEEPFEPTERTDRWLQDLDEPHRGIDVAANDGGADPDVDYVVQTEDYNAVVVDGDVLLVAHGLSASDAVAMQVVGGAAEPESEQLDASPILDVDAAETDGGDAGPASPMGFEPAVASATTATPSGDVDVGDDAVQFRKVLPGVDIVYSADGDDVEYSFVIEPGGDPGEIELDFTGATALSLGPDGDLLIEAAAGPDYVSTAPVTYQVVNGEPVVVESTYRLDAVGTVGFQLGAYDPSLPVVIDPTFVARYAVAGSYANGATIDLDVPAGTGANDLLLAQVAYSSAGGSGIISTPSGWTLLSSSTSNGLRQSIYWRLATGSEPAQYSFTLTGGSTETAAGAMVAYDDVDIASPVGSGASAIGGSGAPLAPAVSASAAGATLVTFFAVRDGGALTPPTGMNERWDVNSDTGGDDEETLLAATDEILAAAGTTGPRTATVSANDGWVAYSLVVNPASGTLTVNSTADVVDQSPGNGSCDTGGTVGSDPECTLRAAIQESNALAGTQTIVVPAGTYNRTISGSFEDASATGDFDINDDVVITGAGSGLVTIDAQALDRVFEVRTGDLTLSGVTVTDGDTSSVGGGIYATSGTVVELSEVVVHDNDASSPGGGVHTRGTLDATDATFSANTSSDDGAAIDGTSSSSITLDRVTITGNGAGGDGGGVNVGGTLIAGDSVIDGNTAGGNGGGLQVTGSSGSATLTNVTISGNDATGTGGAIDNDDTIVLINATVANNTANTTGGVADSGSATLRNTIVAGNSGSSHDDVSGTFTSSGNNIIGEDGSSSGWVGSDLLDTDPLLSALADNGGPTRTHAIGITSPALDAGTATSAPSTDQRGTARPIDGDGDTTATHDIGSFEYDPGAGGGGSGTDLLMVTNNGGFTNGNDSAKKTLFEGWGWTVTGIAGSSSLSALTAAAASNDVLFFSDTAGAGSANVATLDIGVVIEILAGWRNTLYSGSDDASWALNTTLSIVDNSHYITSPFSTGSLTIHTSNDDVNYWNSGSNALPTGVTVLADSPTSTSHDALFVAETGATLYSANTAVNRRVWFPSDAANPSVFTSDYETLLERSLAWAASDGAASATITVNSTGDGGDDNVGNGACSTGATITGGDPECTLRAAIEEANASTVVDTIEFAIPTSDSGYTASPLSYTLTPASGYPLITSTMTIDATTQSGWSGDPIIELDGTSAAGATAALAIRADDSRVSGFAIHSFPDEGLEVDGSTGAGDRNVLTNNWVGLDASGTVIGNTDHGILVTVDALDNRIGGTGANEGNRVAGSGGDGINVRTNSFDNALLGNEVWANTGTGIDLDDDGLTANDPGDGDAGSNDLLNAPRVSAAWEDGGTVNVTFDLDVPSNPDQYRVEFFTNPSGADPTGAGEGQSFLSTLTTAPGAGLSHSFPGSLGDIITATVTEIDSGAAAGHGPTSEFSNAAIVAASAVTSASFQEGANGYGGTVDTWISSSVPTQDNSGLPAIELDGSPVQDGLIRFDSIIGASQGQIPAGATVLSADLVVQASDPSASDATVSLHRMLSSWVETNTWNSLGSGVSTDDVEASSATDATHTGGLDLTDTAIVIDGLTAAVQAWVDGGSNQGWFLSIDRTDGWDVRSSESTPAIRRPRLDVTYVVGSLALVVNSTADGGDTNPGDHICDTGATNSMGAPQCTLRAAIEEANASSIVDAIEFAMPTGETGHAGGVWTIGPGSSYPSLTAPVDIDASTQAGWSSTPVVELDGSSAGASTDGLRIVADSVTVRGLAINRFGADGIELVSGAADASIVGNHIGLDATGLVDRGNGAWGVDLGSGSGPTTVGGTTAADRNVISGNTSGGITIWNSDDNVIIGNYVGTDATGNASGTGIGNGADGIWFGSASSGNTIGQPGAGNVLSGNSNDGIENTATGANNTIQANTIGLGADGTTAVQNDRYGIVIYDGANNTQVGGSGAGEGNVISNNGDAGVIINGNGNAATTANTIAGNLIGTDATGTLDRGNVNEGIELANGANGNTIGGSTSAHGNVISGNGSGEAGVTITGAASSGNVIRFNTIGLDSAGTSAIANNLHGIRIESPSTQVLDNTISGNDVHGIYVYGANATGTQILRNSIGTNAAETAAVPNGIDGIRLEGGSGPTTIGSAGDGNVISGNAQHGIDINDSNGNTIQANHIGTNAGGTLDLGNTDAGVYVEIFNSSNNLIGGSGAGDGNTIAYNDEGARLQSGTGNAVIGNAIYANSELGIDLAGGSENAAGVTDNDSTDGDSGTNDLLNYPVLTSVVEVGGIVTADFDLDAPAGDYRVELFANPSGADGSGNGEGETFVHAASITHTGSGSESFSTGFTGSTGDVITATTTEDLGGSSFGSTSEFSAAVTAVAGTLDPVVFDRVQSGTVTLGSGATSVAATLDAVDTSASFLSFSVRGGANEPRQVQVSGELTDSTTVTFSRDTSGVELVVEWSVVEFTSGVSVQRGTATHSGSAVVDTAISAVDLGRSFVMLGGYQINGTTFDGNDFIQAELSSPTNLRLTVGFATPSTVPWQVITYNDASVQRGSLSFGAGDGSRTATPSSVDPAKAWLVYSYSTAPGTATDIGQKLVRGQVANATTLTFDRSNTGQTIDLQWQLIEFTDSTEVQHASAAFGSATSNAAVSISAVDRTRAIATGGYLGRGGRTGFAADDNPGYGWFTSALTGATTASLERAITGASADVGWFVIEWACADADADGVTDCHEDADTDGDHDPATNPGPDTDGDTTPDHLDNDDDGDGTATSAENADPNGDGDPRDARDSDRDGQPDYLDLPTMAAALDIQTEQKISDTTGGLTATLNDSDGFGSGAAPIGDLDDDGIVDLLVGADGAGTGGAAHVLFLDADGTVKAEQQISNGVGGLTASLLAGDGFGSAVTGLGDIDGDGVEDVMVAADQDDTGGGGNGAVYVLFLKTDGTVRAEQKIAEGVGGLAESLNDNSRFGSSVTAIGDLDGDGINDVAVGAAGDDTNGSFTGAVYVLFLNPDGTVKAEQKITHGVGGLTATVAAGDTLSSAAGIGDLDGDGVADLVVGAYAADEGGSARGAVHVLFLNTDGTVKGEQKISDTAGGLSATLDDSDFFGISVGAIGDYDADGAPDIAVGATWDDDAASNGGALYLLGLNTDGTVKTEQKVTQGIGGFTGPLDSWDLLGGAVAGLGDLDEDGTMNLVVGASGDDDGGSGRGAVYVLDLSVAPCGTTDADADGLLDCEEDANTDADDDPATSPGPDTDGDTIPNYLDSDDDGDGALTSAENADPNGDGDPRDARDSDRDGQPDWLDPPAGAATLLVETEQKISDTAGGLAATLDDGDELGRSVTALGDLDGDGIGDVAAGLWSDDDGGTNRGAVHILFLNADGTVKAEQKISDTAGGLSATLDDGDAFGHGLAVIGDLDGDGIGDLAVGAQRDDDGGTDRGAVHILFLNADGTVKAEQKISSTVGGLNASLDDDDLFGHAVGTIGDLDGDGIPDLAVAAHLDDDGGTNRGAVHILFLNTDGTVKAEQKISDTAGALGATLADNDRLGMSIAGLGDVDGDGTIDLIAGASTDDDGGTNRGAVHILFLNTDGTVKADQEISGSAGGFPDTISNYDEFGYGVAGLGDIDGDGVVDAAVGARYNDTGGTNHGALWLITLDTDGTTKAAQVVTDGHGGFTGPLADDGFGSAIAGLGDLDGDGPIGLLVGAPASDDGGTDRGALYVLDLSRDAAASATLDDASIRRSNLIAAGTVDTSTPVTGVVADGLTYGGGADRLVAPATDLASGAWTLSAWFNASAFGQDPRLAAKAASDGSAVYELLVDDSSATAGQALARLKLGVTTHTVSGGSLTTGGWHHLVATWDGATMSLHVDGSLVDSTPAAGTIATDLAVPLTVGNLAAADRGFSGVIDEVRLSHDAHSAARIGFEYANVTSPGTVVSVGAEQGAAPDPWTISGAQTRSGSSAALAPEVTTSGVDAWLTATGLDEPGVVFTTWWWMSSATGVDLAAGTRAGSVATDQYETAVTSGSGWDLATDIGGVRTQQASPAGTPPLSQWVQVRIETDESGSSSVTVNGSQVIAPTAQGTARLSGSVGLRAGQLPSGQTWYVDDARARKLIADEPTTSVGPLERY